MQATAWIILWYVLFRGRLEVRGEENLAQAMHLHKDGAGIIFASNHFSELDPGLIFIGMSPFRYGEFPMYYVAGAKEMFKNPKFGWRRFIYGGLIFHISGSFPLHGGKKDYATALATHIDLLTGGKKVCIFPEGKMVTPNEKPKAHGGVAYLAEASASPVLPIAISRHGTHVVVEYLPLVWSSDIIDPTEDESIRYRNAAEKIMTKISAARL